MKNTIFGIGILIEFLMLNGHASLAIYFFNLSFSSFSFPHFAISFFAANLLFTPVKHSGYPGFIYSVKRLYRLLFSCGPKHKRVLCRVNYLNSSSRRLYCFLIFCNSFQACGRFRSFFIY